MSFKRLSDQFIVVNGIFDIAKLGYVGLGIPIFLEPGIPELCFQYAGRSTNYLPSTQSQHHTRKRGENALRVTMHKLKTQGVANSDNPRVYDFYTSRQPFNVKPYSFFG